MTAARRLAAILVGYSRLAGLLLVLLILSLIHI